jgi:hypothetical protein
MCIYRRRSKIVSESLKNSPLVPSVFWNSVYFSSSENTNLDNNEERWLFNPETHIKRQATWHGKEGKLSEKMCSEEKNILYWAD